jgi:hypothetical protein
VWADHYATLEERFSRLVPLVTPLMSQSEVAFVDEYLEANEFGLALEIIVDNLIRESAAIPETAYQEIEALSRLMEGLVDDQLSNITIA